MQQFHSYGKLLISGEYVVLDGATALALPTTYGQTMEIKEIAEPLIKWKSVDYEYKIWFEEEYELSDLLSSQPQSKYENNEVSKMLFLTLLSASRLRPGVLNDEKGFEVTTKADFPRSWGLGTSSTLIANLAKWLKIDPYKLLKNTFKGSGYDVAVAMNGTAITFEKQGLENSILKTTFDPPFKDRLFFVHLNQKQNSRQSINHYQKQNKEGLTSTIEKISAITHRMITCTELLDFKLLMEVHENLISQVTGLQKVKSKLFPDFQGAIKSLGGWGGDFIMVTGTGEDMEYFRQKGYSTVIPYEQMIKN
jgi:mevalonate kinase